MLTLPFIPNRIAKGGFIMLFSLLENYKSTNERFCNSDFVSSDSTLILIKSGCLLVKDHDKVLHIGQCEGIYLSKNTKCHFEFPAPTTYFLFRFKSDFPLFQETKITFQDTERIQSTFALLEALEEDQTSSSFAYRKSLFADLITQYSIEHFSKTADNAFQDPLISDAISYLQAHIRTDWKIEEIAEKYNISAAQFSKRFQAVTKMTPAKYMSYLKIQRAKDLLADPNLRIKEIASECGFANEYYFSNFFKKHTALSPTNYRNKILGIS